MKVSHALMLAGLGLVAAMSGCSRSLDEGIEKRPGKTVEMMELEGRVRDLESIVEAREQERVAAAFAKETALSVAYVPGTNWSPPCISMARKGSSRSFVFCGSRLIEQTDDITALDLAVLSGYRTRSY